MLAKDDRELVEPEEKEGAIGREEEPTRREEGEERRERSRNKSSRRSAKFGGAPADAEAESYSTWKLQKMHWSALDILTADGGG